MAWLVIIGIILLILSVTNPFFGLITYMGILYLRPQEVHPVFVPYHIARVFAIATIIGFFLKYGYKGKIFLNNRQDKILIAILFVILLSCLVGWVPKCLDVFDSMAKNVIIYALIVGLVTTKRRLSILLWFLLIMSAILGFNTVQEYRALDPIAQHIVRLGGFSGGYFGGAGDFAVMLNVIIPFAFFLAINGRPLIFRPMAFIMGLILIAGMVVTRSRGGLIAFGVIMLGFGYFGLRSKGFFKKFISILLVVGAIGGIIAFAPSAFKERAATIADYQHQATATRRIEYWKLGIKMFLSNPIIGVGAGNFPIRYWDFGGWEKRWRVPHNMFIEVLSEIGMLGFLCLMLLLYFTFKDSRNTAKLLSNLGDKGTFLLAINQAAILSLIGYCAGGMFQSIFTYPIFYIIIAVIVAIKNMSLELMQEK